MVSQSGMENITCGPFHTEQVNPEVVYLNGMYRSLTLSVWGRLVSTYRCFANISHFALMDGMTLLVALPFSQRAGQPYQRPLGKPISCNNIVWKHQGNKLVTEY